MPGSVTGALSQKLVDAFPDLSATEQRIAVGLYRLLTIGEPVSPEQMARQLKSAVPDETDAQNILIAFANRLEQFVTVDSATILKHADLVQKVSGIRAMLPSRFHAKVLAGST